MAYYFSNATLMCPTRHIEEKGDVLVDQGLIVALGPEAGRHPLAASARRVQAEGLIAAPGLIDLHVHLRQPGQEYKETIASGTRAAAAGGFTAVCPMANTQPVNDSPAVTRFILETATREAAARVYPIAALSQGLAGEALSEMASLKEAGARAFSDDGKPLADSRLFRRALQYAHGLDMPVICHSEDLSLSRGGVMHEGAISTRLGLSGIPAEAESLGVARDVIVAGMTGARIHIAHVSCAQSLDIIRMAKQRGIKVTCETAPHYLLLCDEDVGNYDAMRKMNPPLRARRDMLALRQGLNDGSIDAIATDHAPHSPLEKEIEFEQAAFGVIGLETALGVMLHLVEQGCLTMMRMLELMSANPARILNLPGGELAAGKAADLVFFSPRQPWVVEKFHSLSQNSPFLGFTLPGRVRYTLCGGQISYGMENL